MTSLTGDQVSAVCVRARALARSEARSVVRYAAWRSLEELSGYWTEEGIPSDDLLLLEENCGQGFVKLASLISAGDANISQALEDLLEGLAKLRDK